MWSVWIRRIYFALVVGAMCTLQLSCDQSGSNAPDQVVGVNEMLVHETDSCEWYVALFYEGLYYEEASTKSLPSPYRLPTKDEARILRDLDYPHRERFITSDGYTFGMPSASVSKAGSKTKYSVLGLRIRYTTIEIEF